MKEASVQLELSPALRVGMCEVRVQTLRVCEALVVVFLNTKMKCCGFQLIHLGTLNECPAHPRDIMRPVLLAAAHSFIAMHNHPSGDPMPSEADRRFIRRIKECAEVFQIRLLDHVVVGHEEPGRLPYFSFREAGMI